MIKYEALIHCHFDTQQNKNKQINTPCNIYCWVKNDFTYHYPIFTPHIFTLGQDLFDFKKVLM